MRRVRGFTLIEILVALSIFLVMATFLLSISGQAANIWRRQNDLGSIRERARAALDMIGTELQLAVLPLDPTVDDSVQLVVNPSSVDGDLQSRDALFWYAPIAANSSHGNLAAVGYFTRKKDNRYQLCRYYAPAGDANFRLYTNPGSWISTALLDTVAPATEASKLKGLFLEDVAGMWVNSYDENNNLIANVDSRAIDKLPARMEISLVFYDSIGVAKAEAATGDGTIPDPTTVASAHEYLGAVSEEMRAHMGAVSISVSFRNRKP